MAGEVGQGQLARGTKAAWSPLPGGHLGEEREPEDPSLLAFRGATRIMDKILEVVVNDTGVESPAAHAPPAKQ